jgi:hypothetical protein
VVLQYAVLNRPARRTIMKSIATVVRKRVCRQAAHVGSSQPVPGRTNRSGEGDAERNRDLKRNQLNSRGF